MFVSATAPGNQWLRDMSSVTRHTSHVTRDRDQPTVYYHLGCHQTRVGGRAQSWLLEICQIISISRNENLELESSIKVTNHYSALITTLSTVTATRLLAVINFDIDTILQ